jgi:hypothetical protein
VVCRCRVMEAPLARHTPHLDTTHWSNGYETAILTKAVCYADPSRHAARAGVGILCDSDLRKVVSLVGNTFKFVALGLNLGRPIFEASALGCFRVSSSETIHIIHLRLNMGSLDGSISIIAFHTYIQ